MVRDNASLTSVTLLANKFDDATVAMLLKLKKEKPTLTTLCGLTPDQTEAKFQMRSLMPQDAKLLAPEILIHTSLTSVRCPFYSRRCAPLPTYPVLPTHHVCARPYLSHTHSSI